jgi:hypothetical protein
MFRVYSSKRMTDKPTKCGHVPTRRHFYEIQQKDGRNRRDGEKCPEVATRVALSRSTTDGMPGDRHIGMETAH